MGRLEEKVDNDTKKIYELWGGKLSKFEEQFVKLDVSYPEVFYTFNL